MPHQSASRFGVVGSVVRFSVGVALIGCVGACAAPAEELDIAFEQDALVTCSANNVPKKAGTVALSELSEASGLVASVRNPNVLYTHNDSGGLSRIYALGATGTHLATLNLQGCATVDWEDIAVGPGPTAGTSYIYVGDIGDNALRRQNVVIERVAEPSIAVTDRDRLIQVSHDSLLLRYPDGAHNAETLLIDPTTGDLYILTKGDRNGSRLYVAPAPLSASTTTTLSYVTTLAIGSGALIGSSLATGGDVRADGGAVLVRTYNSVFLWRRAPGAPFGSVFSTSPCSLPSPSEPQGEAIAFGGDGASFFTLSEGISQPLFRALLE